VPDLRVVLQERAETPVEPRLSRQIRPSGEHHREIGTACKRKGTPPTQQPKPKKIDALGSRGRPGSGSLPPLSPTNKKPRIVPSKWSTVEMDELIKCRKDGMSFQEISERLNRTPTACHRYARILGCTKNQPMWSADEIGKLRDLRRLGHSWSDIGQQLGRSLHSCQQRYKRLNQTPQSLAHRHS
jgi:hypothetical protein